MSGLALLSPGATFAGDYRIVRPHREGGMGAVYVAEQTSTARRCALKVMQPDLVHHPEARKRFLREARIGAQLQSDFVVQVIQAGVDESTGMPWLAMELLDGDDLEAYVTQKGRLEPREIVAIFDQICDALGEAHSKGIIHRDLKPENIFLASPRRRRDRFTVKILDFGIARLLAEIQTTSSKTRKAMGTPLYMAPEQAQPGLAVGPFTDVWALGLIAFRLLTGWHYWRTAHDPNATVVMLAMEAYVHPLAPPSVRAAEWNAGVIVPSSFDDWFLRCLARSSADRFPTATAAFSALEAVFSQVPSKTILPDTDRPNKGASPPAADPEVSNAALDLAGVPVATAPMLPPSPIVPQPVVTTPGIPSRGALTPQATLSQQPSDLSESTLPSGAGLVPGPHELQLTAPNEAPPNQQDGESVHSDPAFRTPATLPDNATSLADATRSPFPLPRVIAVSVAAVLLASAGILALVQPGMSKSGNTSESSTPTADGAALLAEARILFGRGDIEGAHKKLVEMPADSNAWKDSSVRDIENAWADWMFQKADSAHDVETKRLILKQIIPNVNVDKRRREMALAQYAALDVVSPATAVTTAPDAGTTSVSGFDEAAIRRSLEQKVWSGKATVEEIRMLKAICSHMGDRACRDRAATMLKQKLDETPP